SILPPDTIQRRAFPEIRSTGRLAFLRGIVYAIGESVEPGARARLYSFGRHEPRIVRLAGSDARGELALDPTGIAANFRSIFVLNGDSLERWPRLVPAEIHLPSMTLTQSLAAFYGYLYDRHILPVRQVPIEQNIENTLKKRRVIPAAYVAELTPLLCNLNRG